MLLNYFISTEKEMANLGEKLSNGLIFPLFIALSGELGSGKTTFVRAILRGLGYLGPVKSPTYTLVESYKFPEMDVFHLDLYRISHPQELEFIGVEELFHARSICLIEWAEKGEEFLPTPDLICQITIPENLQEDSQESYHASSPKSSRNVHFKSFSARGEAILKWLSTGVR